MSAIPASRTDRIAAVPGARVTLAAALIAEMPGPAMLVAADGAITQRNPPAEPLMLELCQGRGKFADAVAACLRDGKPRQDTFAVTGKIGQLVFNISLLPTAEVPKSLLVLGRDVTLERNLTQALVSSRQLFKDLVSCSSEFAWQTRADGSFDFVSPQGALGYSAKELEGRTTRQLMDPAVADAVMPFESRTPLDLAEVWLIRKDGDRACLQVSCLPVIDAAGTWRGARGVCRDVTAARQRDAELAKAHAMLEQLSRTDELTGLLNRRAFAEELSRRLPHLRRHGRCGALLYLDLDNFKAINDHYGHPRGDQALKSVAALLQRDSRAADLIGRLGGDEFVLWLEDTGKTGANAKATALVHAVAAMDADVGVAGRPFGLSIGIAVSGGDEPIGELLERADRAMYDAKHAGKSAVAIAPAV